MRMGSRSVRTGWPLRCISEAMTWYHSVPLMPVSSALAARVSAYKPSAVALFVESEMPTPVVESKTDGLSAPSFEHLKSQPALSDFFIFVNAPTTISPVARLLGGYIDQRAKISSIEMRESWWTPVSRSLGIIS